MVFAGTDGSVTLSTIVHVRPPSTLRRIVSLVTNIASFGSAAATCPYTGASWRWKVAPASCDVYTAVPGSGGLPQAPSCAEAVGSVALHAAKLAGPFAVAHGGVHFDQVPLVDICAPAET